MIVKASLTLSVPVLGVLTMPPGDVLGRLGIEKLSKPIMAANPCYTQSICDLNERLNAVRAKELCCDNYQRLVVIVMTSNTK